MATRSKQLNQKDESESKLLNDEEAAAKRRKRIQEYTLMDDVYMTKFFENNIACAQLVLRIIMGRDDLVVKELHTQHTLENLQGHSVRFDVYTKDGKHMIYDMEIQRADKGAGAKRARYYSSVIDANTLKESKKYETLQSTYVIFITEKDFIGYNKPLYTIERTINEVSNGANKSFRDGSHIIYVNGAYEGDSPLGKLMHDFRCANPDDMCYTILKERAKELKGYAKGESTMYIDVEDLDRVSQAIYDDGVEQGEIRGKISGHALGVAEGRAEGRAAGRSEAKTEMLKCYLEAGNTLEDAFSIFKITDVAEQDKFRKLITV